jgi:hypothetical protein
MAEATSADQGTFVVTVSCLQRQCKLQFQGECHSCVIPMLLVKREMGILTDSFDIILQDGDNIEAPDPELYREHVLVLSKAWEVLINLTVEETDVPVGVVALPVGMLHFINCATGAEIRTSEAKVSQTSS